MGQGAAFVVAGACAILPSRITTFRIITCLPGSDMSQRAVGVDLQLALAALGVRCELKLSLYSYIMSMARITALVQCHDGMAAGSRITHMSRA